MLNGPNVFAHDDQSAAAQLSESDQFTDLKIVVNKKKNNNESQAGIQLAHSSSQAFALPRITAAVMASNAPVLMPHWLDAQEFPSLPSFPVVTVAT